MKLNKISMKKLLIIILSVFVLVPIVLMLLGYDRTISEGFFNMADDGYGDNYTVPNTKITAIDAPEISNNSYDVESGKLYCVLGNIKCANGFDASLVNTDIDGINVYTCVSNNVIDNTQASCDNSIFSGSAPFLSTNTNSVNFYKHDSDNCLLQESGKPSAYELKSFENKYDITSTDLSGDLSNFTSAYASVPLKFTSDGSYNYVILEDVIGDTNWTDTSLSSCFMFKTKLECEQNYGKCPDLQTTETGTSSSSSSNKLDTKCLGDFGDTTGDKLCCGQTGVIQSEHAKYTCPESHPYCRNYKCGDSWGSCYKGDD